MVTGQVSCKRQQEAKLALMQCRVVRIDIQECNGGSQTKTRDSIFVYTSVTGDNFTFILWREDRSYILEAMSFRVVVCVLTGIEKMKLATHIAAEMSLTRRSQVHLARFRDRTSLPSTPMGILDYLIYVSSCENQGLARVHGPDIVCQLLQKRGDEGI